MDDGIAIDVVDGGHDSVLEFLFGRNADVAQNGACELREEALDEIEPGAVLRGEDEGEAPFGSLGEPGLGFPGNMGRVIVEDELDRSRRRVGGVELLQEGDEFAGPVSLLDAGVDLAGQKVDAGQEAQRPVPDIFVIAPYARMARRRGRQVRRRRSNRLQAGLLVVRDDRDRRGCALSRGLLQEFDLAIDFAPPALVPSWARCSGWAGDGDALFAAGASLALLDAFLRRDPPCAGVLRQRLALQAAAASAKILRLRADPDSLRDLRFALTGELGPPARMLELWRDLVGRLPVLDGRQLVKAVEALDLPLADPDSLAAGLRDAGKDGDPVSAATRAAAAAFAAFPDAPAAAAEVLALCVFDCVLADRLRWERPLPLIATKILDPTLRTPGADRRARPGEPRWERTAAMAIALAAASALDLGADLSRRAETLLTVAPKLRARPAQKIVERLLAEDAVAPSEAARAAKMSERSARRLFERLITLGAVRELSGRPSFRMFGL